MAQGTRICKICGKEYPFCKTPNPNNVFRFQDVACCEEHGAQYLEAILRSRGELPEKKADVPAEPKEVFEDNDILDEDDFDEEDDLDEEDDEFDEDEDDID